MKATVDTAEFRDAVGWAARALPGRPTTQMQVLGGLLLTADDDTLAVDAFDYETARHVAATAVAHTPGRLLVGGRLLAQVAERLPGQQVELVADGSHLVVTSADLTARLPTMSADDYPTLPALPPALGTVDADVLRAAVKRVTVAAGRDDTLPVLTGASVEAVAGSPLRLACTDRYRLAVADVDWRCQTADGTGVAMVVPAETLRDLADRANGTVTVHLGTGASGEGLAGLAWADRHATTRIVDGAFPPYRRLIPAEDRIAVTLTVGRAALVDALDRVKPTTGKTTPVVLEAVGDRLTVSAKDPNGAGQIDDVVACQLDGLDNVTLAYNPHYLRDALVATSGDSVRVRFAAPDKPNLVVGDDPGSYTHMLMPIRLNS